MDRAERSYTLADHAYSSLRGFGEWTIVERHEGVLLASQPFAPLRYIVLRVPAERCGRGAHPKF